MTFDRPVRVTYPDGTTEESVYDRFDLITSKDRLDQWTRMLYITSGDLHAVVNPAGETIQMDWCGCGALTRLVDAEGRITAFDYDLAGRLTRKELPDGSATTYGYHPVNSGDSVYGDGGLASVDGAGLLPQKTARKTNVTTTPSPTPPSPATKPIKKQRLSRRSPTKTEKTPSRPPNSALHTRLSHPYTSPSLKKEVSVSFRVDTINL